MKKKYWMQTQELQGLVRIQEDRSRSSQRSEVCNFIKKETLAQVFSSEFYEISKNTFFTEHFLTTASTDHDVTTYVYAG